MNHAPPPTKPGNFAKRNKGKGGGKNRDPAPAALKRMRSNLPQLQLRQMRQGISMLKSARVLRSQLLCTPSPA